MHILRIEHPVPDFADWKKAFDGDPMNRRESGVRRYRVYWSANDPGFAGVELEFDDPTDAEAMLVRLHQLWSRVEGTVMNDPRARIFEVLEEVDLSANAAGVSP